MKMQKIKATTSRQRKAQEDVKEDKDEQKAFEEDVDRKNKTTLQR